MKKRKIQKAVFSEFDQETDKKNKQVANNFDILKGLDVNLTVEFARTKTKMEDILNLSIGSIIELGKDIGEPLDLLVNGKKVASGEIVVIDDEFSIRITEIVGNKD